MNRIKPGMIIQHFKGEDLDRSTGNTCYLYKVIGSALHTETQEELIVYEALYPPFAMFARPISMMNSLVDKNRYPDIKQEYRFEEYKER